MLKKLKLLKTSPEGAINRIEADIVEAYELKDKIWDDYGKVTVKTLRASGGEVDKWSHWIEGWKSKTLEHLFKIYSSKRVPYNFRDTRGTYFDIGIMSHDTTNLIISIEAKIEYLNHCVEFIFDNFKVNIIAAGRDVNYQAGADSKMEVKNDGGGKRH